MLLRQIKFSVNSGMPRQTLYLWKQAPFLRLIIPFMAGIALQWYAPLPVAACWALLATAVAALVLFNLRSGFLQYRFGWVNGLLIHLLLFLAGWLLAYYKDASHRQPWFNHYYSSGNCLVVTLAEPLSAKPNSYKSIAAVDALLQPDMIRTVQGTILIYFKKDSLSAQLHYGSQIVFNKKLQAIRNSGNPGAFNYEQYAAFMGIYQQVFLAAGEYRLLPGKEPNSFRQFLFTAREKIVHIISRYIPGQKEAGLAEALLVGYKDDLDKNLVQSYTNTGVVHIIAISGMHLALIYWLLNTVLSPLKNTKQTKWLVPVAVLMGLWLFSLLAGGGPSILRSAVMFTGLVLGESLQRKAGIYNALAASAFILLCINPGWLWDAGFQLSYTALLSIVIFNQPIYQCCHFQNKIIDGAWKLMAVSLAAQVLTTPVSIYHFHQFPVYFLLTNLVAVPLSSIIVLLEIFLCMVSFMPLLAKFTGITLHWLLYEMNSFIERIESLPFSGWNGLQVNMPQVLLLYGCIIGLACWLMKKNKAALLPGLACLLGFLCIRTISFVGASRQQQLIVYNLPGHQAMDLISGRTCCFRGDTDLQTNATLQACRSLHRVNNYRDAADLGYAGALFFFGNKKIVLVDTGFNLHAPGININADLVIVSRNALLPTEKLLQVFNCRQIIFDGSNTARNVNKWKQEAAKLGLSCFYTVDNGAFVMNMD